MPRDIFNSHVTKDQPVTAVDHWSGLIDQQPENPEPAHRDFSQAQSLCADQL